MQICELCKNYTECELPKRDHLDLFARCDDFMKSVTSLQYERIAAAFIRTRQESGALQFPSTTDFLPSDLISPNMYLDFVGCNLADAEDRGELKRRNPGATDFVFVGADRPDHPGHPRLVEVQTELRWLVGLYKDDAAQFIAGRLGTTASANEKVPMDTLNSWLARLKVQVQAYPKFREREEDEAYDSREGDGPSFRWRTESAEDGQNEKWRGEEWHLHPRLHVHREPAGGYPENRLAILFAQFANDMLRQQQLMECPSCKVVFKSSGRRDAGATCGQPKCKMWAQRKRAAAP